MKLFASIILIVAVVVAKAQDRREGVGKPFKNNNYVRVLQEAAAADYLSLSFPGIIEGQVEVANVVSAQMDSQRLRWLMASSTRSSEPHSSRDGTLAGLGIVG